VPPHKEDCFYAKRFIWEIHCSHPKLAMPAKRKANSKVVEMVLVRKSSLIEFDQNVEAGAAGARRMG